MFFQECILLLPCTGMQHVSGSGRGLEPKRLVRSYRSPRLCLLISCLLSSVLPVTSLCCAAAFALVFASSSAATSHIDFSDLEYSLSLLTKSSKSCCLASRFSSERRCNCGLYFCAVRQYEPHSDLADRRSCLEQLLFGRSHVVNQSWSPNAHDTATRFA